MAFPALETKMLVLCVPTWIFSQAILSISLVAAPPAEIATFLSDNCKGCHNASDNAGGLDLDSLTWSIESRENQERWIRIHDRVVTGEMPPDSALSDEARGPISTSLRDELLSEVTRRQDADGRTAFRRLNRREFESSLHD